MDFSYSSTTVCFFIGIISVTAIFKQLRRRQETVSTDDVNYIAMQHDYMDHNYNLFDENHYPNIESRGNGSNQLDKFPSSTEEDSYITVLEENDVE